jgi:hypothetical protein
MCKASIQAALIIQVALGWASELMHHQVCAACYAISNNNSLYKFIWDCFLIDQVYGGMMSQPNIYTAWPVGV